jgi:hypothetical protein
MFHWLNGDAVYVCAQAGESSVLQAEISELKAQLQVRTRGPSEEEKGGRVKIVASFV